MSKYSKAIASFVFFLLSSFMVNGQYLRNHVLSTESYGIDFQQPDTITTLKAFQRNNPAKFLTEEVENQRLSIKEDAVYKDYEKQRIVDGQNIFLCFRIKDHGMWTRHTYWIHFDKSGVRPVFRQRVYIDADSSDLSDGNDVLVFQTNYHAFEICDATGSDDEVTELKGLKMLEYIEELITFNFRLHADPWITTSYPEYGNITSHEKGLYYNTYPAYAIGGLGQQRYNPNHELYLGIQSLTLDSSSLFILFYPIGDVLALHSTGDTWIKYQQFYASKNNFELKLSKKLTFMGFRKYFVGLQGTYSRYYYDGVIAEQYYNMNGYSHGPHITNSEYGGKVSGGFRTGYIKIVLYYYDYLSESIYLSKEAEIGIHSSTWDYMSDTYMEDHKEIKKAYRKYKKHCRKWHLVKTVMTQ